MTESPPRANVPPRSTLPERPSLERQKKLAKALLRRARGGDPEALARLLALHPAPAQLRNRAPRLADAQVVLAREYGLPSWPALRDHVLDLERMANQIDVGSPALDRERDTLHIRCGSDIREGLVKAGFAGAFLEFSDPMCRGPLSAAPLPEYLRMRGRWIGETWTGDTEATEKRLTREYDGLRRAAQRERVILWFEHDPYDQLILARVLKEIAAWDSTLVEIVLLDDYPGVGRFMGLGQLPPTALRSLWERRQPVTKGMTDLGTRTWAALTAGDPPALMEVIATGTPAVPAMAGALERHLAELPGIHDGLALLERLTLQALQNGPIRGGPLFGRVMRLDPLPFLGDTMMAEVLRGLASGPSPAIEMLPGSGREGEPWHRLDWRLTSYGTRLLQGHEDWLSTCPAPRFVGGIRIEPGRPVWRWNSDSRTTQLTSR